MVFQWFFYMWTIGVDGFSMVFFSCEPLVSMVSQWFFYMWTIGVNGFSMVFHISTIGTNGFSNGFFPPNHCHWMNGFTAHHFNAMHLHQWLFNASHKKHELWYNIICDKNRSKLLSEIPVYDISMQHSHILGYNSVMDAHIDEFMTL